MTDLMTPTQVCERLKIGAPTLARWRKAGKIPYVPMPGGQFRYDRADVEKIAANRRVSPENGE